MEEIVAQQFIKDYGKICMASKTYDRLLNVDKILEA
jgi:hypothetical protein